MKNEELRSIFQRVSLPSLFLNNPEYFYRAFNSGTDEVSQLINNLWADLCKQVGDHVNNHPLRVEIDYIVLDDSEDDYTVLLVAQLPNIKKVDNLANYFAVVFGNSKRRLRLFLGETDYSAIANRYIFVVELVSNEGAVVRLNLMSLYRGCGNNRTIFEKPINQRVPNEMIGIDPEDEVEAFADAVAVICSEPLDKDDDPDTMEVPV